MSRTRRERHQYIVKAEAGLRHYRHRSSYCTNRKKARKCNKTCRHWTSRGAKWCPAPYQRGDAYVPSRTVDGAWTGMYVSKAYLDARRLRDQVMQGLPSAEAFAAWAERRAAAIRAAGEVP
jgi:hypothetical protein